MLHKNNTALFFSATGSCKKTIANSVERLPIYLRLAVPSPATVKMNDSWWPKEAGA